jgi:hypothetical protein
VSRRKACENCLLRDRVRSTTAAISAAFLIKAASGRSFELSLRNGAASRESLELSLLNVSASGESLELSLLNVSASGESLKLIFLNGATSRESLELILLNVSVSGESLELVFRNVVASGESFELVFLNLAGSGESLDNFFLNAACVAPPLPPSPSWSVERAWKPGEVELVLRPVTCMSTLSSRLVYDCKRERRELARLSLLAPLVLLDPSPWLGLLETVSSAELIFLDSSLEDIFLEIETSAELIFLGSSPWLLFFEPDTSAELNLLDPRRLASGSGVHSNSLKLVFRAVVDCGSLRLDFDASSESDQSLSEQETVGSTWSAKDTRWDGDTLLCVERDESALSAVTCAHS